jgi:toxin ParE1/3/4
VAPVKIRSTRLALRDLECAVDLAAAEDRAAAAPLMARIERTAAALARHPAAGREGRIAGTRELAVTGTPFVMAYRAVPDAIEILALFHRARRWPERQ